jgi:phosphatidylserine/phosphatidylglycerophosphate/cardiolipin synthase-like enzyme
MKLLVQPDDGATPLVKAIQGARTSIDILIFRFDRKDIERALLNAVGRGVRVRALIAYTNRGGEKNLRALEMRLLAAGVMVARTSDVLLRYHGKMIIIDRRALYMLAFNFTYADMDRSRSFGVVTKDRKLVQEAEKLFEADMQRQEYTPAAATFIVSPLNARKELSTFIKAAKKELLIYDPAITDATMVRLLNERAEAGVNIRIVGRGKLPARKLTGLRLHTRTIIRDGAYVFIGSQSLRRAELDKRREIGLIFRDPKIALQLAKLFNEDSEGAQPAAVTASTGETVPAGKIAKRVAKAVTNGLPPMAPVLEVVVKQVAGNGVDVSVKSEDLQDRVQNAVKQAVKEAVRDAVEDAALPGKAR